MKLVTWQGGTKPELVRGAVDQVLELVRLQLEVMREQLRALENATGLDGVLIEEGTRLTVEDLP